MLIWGWGSKNKVAQLTDGQALVLRYRYFHLFWLFRVTWDLRYALALATPNGWATRDLTVEEYERFEAPRRLTIHWWWRYGLAVGLVSLVVFITLMTLTNG